MAKSSQYYIDISKDVMLAISFKRVEKGVEYKK